MELSAQSTAYLALGLAFVLPGILFVASMHGMLGCLRSKQKPLSEYIWVTGHALVGCLAMVWIAANIASLREGRLGLERAQATLEAGPYIFVALLLVLCMRHVVGALLRAGHLLARRAAQVWALVFSGKKEAAR